MSLMMVAGAIVLLLLLIIIFRLNAFISFIIVSVLLGLCSGLPAGTVAGSIQKGIGETLGSLVMILGFGAMLGKLVADSGAASRITSLLIKLFGIKNIQWAMVLTGFIVGIPMFYNVGFVVLIPLVFTVAESTGLPLLYVGVPMLASLSVTHGFLPPHPSPTAIAGMFGADIGKTLLYGTIIGLPSIAVAGPFFSRTLKKIHATPIKDFVSTEGNQEKSSPGSLISIVTTLMPVILIGLSSIALIIFPHAAYISPLFRFLGDPVIAMLLSLLLAVWLLGIARGRKMDELMESLAHSVSSVTMILLIIAGAGGFKQVLIDSGISDKIASLLGNSGLSPLFLAWSIAALIRVCVGSATVAGLTTAGIVLPLATGGTVNKELLVLAIGAGSLTLSHVNDGGFWMFKEYFNLSVKETFMSWTVMETLVSILGLGGILLLNMII
ncbi:MAG TPA: gluconate:H+ symporter [Bacteroidales bacterium]|nr:gluconate:H+ symporter [Bacteroidales bacterium]